MISYQPYKPIIPMSMGNTPVFFAHNKGEKHDHKHDHTPSGCQDSHCSVDHTKTVQNKKTASPPPKLSAEETGDFITRSIQKFWEWLKAFLLSPFRDLEWLFKGGYSQEKP